MKVHTTNYQDAFIEIAEDCPVAKGEVPPLKNDQKTAANIQFDMISKNPYQYTSDDVLFQVFAIKNDLTESELQLARAQFFSKGQPCFRASPLTKRYGWGLHSDKNGKIAIYSADSDAYQNFLADKGLEKVKAMKSKR
ncbi:MAG: hypothetical protein IPL95_13840 [Saprospiraceae bacterium]|nr:hypothetical protein [Saprospiraceae bacterium]